MAVGAQEHAFSRFSTQGLKRQRDALLTERKLLLGWVDVMERERPRLPCAVVRDHLRWLKQQPLRRPRLHPPTAPIASTTLYEIGSIGLGRVAVSAVICLLATVATARLAASVYERSILRIGARVRLREALRSEG